MTDFPPEIPPENIQEKLPEDPPIYPRDPAQLRKVILKKRNLVPPDVRTSHFKKIMENLLRLPEFRQASHIIGYYGKTSSGEFDTLPLLHHILSNGKTLLLPRCHETEITLDIYKITDLQNDVEIGAYEIHEPKRSCPLVIPPDNCLILVPGSVFDPIGARYGYGAGFYDNYLKNHPFTKVAFAMDCCVMDFSLTTHEKDIFMDYILTQSQVYPVDQSAE
ncbi:MAG: 5-formyltetrahydrofolate cyclo-ligase [Promethearchaeota archaeon]